YLTPPLSDPSLLSHISQRIFVSQVQVPTLHLSVKLRPLFDRQLVKGEMLGHQGDRSVHIGQPASQGLAREPVDQVQVQVGKASPASRADGTFDLLSRMRRVGRSQLRIVERLRAQAETVASTFAERS